MPEPVTIGITEIDFNEFEPAKGYTASQVQEAYAAGRAAGLEAAAEAIDDECRERIMTASDCIDAIRNLKETP